MTSDEKLVAMAAKEVLEANGNIEPKVQLATETDSESLALPAIVLSAKLEEEEPSSPMPKRYSLTAELRAVNKAGESEALDEVFAEMCNTLCPVTSGAFAVPPPTMVTSFAYYRIENQSGSDNSPGSDTSARSRTFIVFAKLL